MLADNNKVDRYKFGAYLKSLRKAIPGLTIRKVDLKSGVSNVYISQVERGIRGVPSPNILRKLAPVYKVSYEELMVDAGYWKRPECATDDPALQEKLMMYMEYYKVAEDAAEAKISPETLRKFISLFENKDK